MIVKSRVDSDGVLRVSVPIGKDEANREVQVIVEPARPTAPLTQEEYVEWVESMAGSWQGEFERPKQGELQERDPL
jgi:hypothetical protein